MKRAVCVILAALLCVAMIPVSAFAEEGVLYTATVDVISTECSNDTCQVYIYDDDCYMYIDDIVRYTRSTFAVEGDILTVTHGTRDIKIDLTNNELTEDGIAVEMKTLHNGDTVVVHAFPMLTYLGATCSATKGKLIINMPESTIWEGLNRNNNEFYITDEMFGDKTEQKIRLLLNGILSLFESGIGGALFENVVQDAFVAALQVDPLDFNSAWEIKNANNKKIETLVTQGVAKGDISDNINEWLSEGTETVMSNIVLDWIQNILVSGNGTDELDKKLISQFDSSKALLGSTSGVVSFLSILSSNKKCTEDAAEMLAALANNLPASSDYHAIILSLYMETKSEITAQVDAGFQAVSQTILSTGVDAWVEKIIDKTGSLVGVESYASISGLMKASLDISVIFNKMLMHFSGEDAFAYSAAETSLLHLLYLRSEVIKAMETLVSKIHNANYRDVEAIEDWRLINALYYKIQIAINQKTEEMIVAQGRQDDADMVTVIEQLHTNTEVFAKNLYILTTATSTAFPDVDKISNSNQWDDDTSIKANAQEVPNGIEGIGASSMKAILTGIEADSIQYYNCSEAGNFAVIEKNAKYGIIGYDGDLILPIKYDRINRGGGYSYDFLLITESQDSWGSYVDKDGNIAYGYPDGGDVRPSSYWYDGGVVIFNADSDVMKLEEFLNHEWYSNSGLKTAGLVLDLREWNSDRLFPVQKISGYTNHNGYYHEPHIDSMQFALMDMNTHELISDFIYEGIDDYNGVSEGLLAVKKDGKWGFVNEEGTVVVDYLYDPYESYTSYGETYEFVYTAVNGHIAVLKDGKWGLIDIQGNIVVDATYDGISQVNPDGMFWLKENGTWSLYQLGA